MTEKKNTTRVNFDVEIGLKRKFDDAVGANLSTTSLVLRHFMKTYVLEHQQEENKHSQLARAATKKKR